MERGEKLLFARETEIKDAPSVVVSTDFLAPPTTRPSSATAGQLGRDRSHSRARAKSTFGRRGDYPIVRVETYKVGIYGWRKRFLYFLVLLIASLVVINAVFIIWIIRLLELSLAGIGSIKLSATGITLNGDAFVQHDLFATSIRSRQGSPLKIQSERALTINGRDESSGELANRLRVTRSSVEAFTNQFDIRGGPDGKLLFHADSDNVIVAADKLRINNEHGIEFNTSLQTPLVRSNPFSDLKLESPTRRISMTAPRGAWIESRTGDITVTCLRDLSLKSSEGKITVEAGHIELRDLKLVGSARREVKSDSEVYQVCICANGRLFVAPPDERCSFDEKICGVALP